MNLTTSNRRLLKLARFLEKLPEDRFNYGRWVGRNWRGAQDLSCGTTACALGWAATMPEFRRLGLCLVGDLPGTGVVHNRLTGDYGDEAAQEVFGLTLDEANYLFYPGSNLWSDAGDAGDVSIEGAPTSPKSDASAVEVAAHIRNFVAHREEWAKAAA